MRVRGSGRRPHVQLRIEFSRRPFDDDHCFLQLTSSALVVISNRAVTSNESVSSFARAAIGSAPRSRETPERNPRPDRRALPPSREANSVRGCLALGHQ
jgi:hypothetical protein